MKFLSFFSLLFVGFFSHAQTWETLQNMPASASQRHHPATFSIGGIGYVVSGSMANYNSLNDFYSYDPNTDSWTTKTDFPGPSRGFGYAVASDTKGYLGFGWSNEPGNGVNEYLNDLWEYDPLTDSWTELAPCPGVERVHPAMVYLNGKIYMGLGGDGSGDLGDWWEYDINTDTWVARATFPGADRHHPYYFAIGDYAYVGMGHSGANIFKDLYRYDPNTDSWTQMTDLPDQGRVAGTQFAYNGKGYVLSGQGENHANLPTGEFWEYDPIADDWTSLTAHPDGGRWAPGSFVIDGSVYFTCGEANVGVLKDLMRFQIEPFVTSKDVQSPDFTLYPNPATSKLFVGNIQKAVQIKVRDLNGKIAFEGILTPNQYIDVSDLASGVYYCQLSTEEGVVVKKLIVD